LADDFAPAQFFEMSDDAKLASPSFQSMQAGLRVGSSQFTLGFAQRVESPLEYETRVIDRKAAKPPPPPARDYRLSEVLLQLHAMQGAAGRSVLRRERVAPANPFAKVEPARWTALTEDLGIVSDAARGVSFVEALGAAQRDRRGMVVRDFELAQLEPTQ